MSNGQIRNLAAMPQTTRFGRPLPQPGQTQPGPAVPQQSNPGMFVPHQSLVNNAAMLGMRNPINSLGFGQYNFPQFNPASLPSALAPAAQTLQPAQQAPQLNWLGQPLDSQPQG